MLGPNAPTTFNALKIVWFDAFDRVTWRRRGAGNARAQTINGPYNSADPSLGRVSWQNGQCHALEPLRPFGINGIHAALAKNRHI
tara:strand:+ start:330 stop:584 length:255 start_codon:yes stop_codon:yes gene_type:complete